jgi:prefoldin subunit 5
MTDIEELRRSFDKASEVIRKNSESITRLLKHAEEARQRMRKAAGLPPDDKEFPE